MIAEPPGLDWTQIAIIAAIIAVIIALGAPYPSQQPETGGHSNADGDTTMTRAPHIIEQVSVQENARQPVLHVVGAQVDGCEFPVQVDQRRDGGTVFVEIYRLIPPEARCPRMPLPYEASIVIEGDFSPTETITFNVNGVVVQTTLE